MRRKDGRAPQPRIRNVEPSAEWKRRERSKVRKNRARRKAERFRGDPDIALCREERARRRVVFSGIIREARVELERELRRFHESVSAPGKRAKKERGDLYSARSA